MANLEKELENQLREVGSKLGSPPTSVDELLALLDQMETFLSRVEQQPSPSMSKALLPAMKALVAKELLRHSDTDVEVAVASCLCEITRITAPDDPYDDELMKKVFQRIVQAFENLTDPSSRSYPKRVSILDSVAKVRSCIVMLDLECADLILDMFRNFFKSISLSHPEYVFSSMETIMTLIIEESDEIASELASCLLDSVKRENIKVMPASFRLGVTVISNCAMKLKPILRELMQSVDCAMNGYSWVVTQLCQQDKCEAVVHNDLTSSGENMIDDRLSERTISDELPQEFGKIGREVGSTEEEIEVSVLAANDEPKDAVKMDTEEGSNEPIATDADINMQDAKSSADISCAGAENGVPDFEEMPTQMNTDAKVETSKTKVKKTNVQITDLVYGGIAAADLQRLVEKEFDMAKQDRVMEETKDEKNAVEAYVYDMRNKLYDKYQDYATTTENDEFIAMLQEIEDWLYEDSEHDVLKSIKYNVWSSTPNGNKKLNAAFEDAQRLSAGKPLKCHVILFFSVNGSGKFCGIAEMVDPVDFMKNMDFWTQDKWIGSFPIKWHSIEDVLDTSSQQLILENNANKHVMHSRDIQQMTFTFEVGITFFQIRWKDYLDFDRIGIG